MDITPPRLPLDSLLKRRPMTVYTVSCPPAEAVARCAQFWRAIGIKRESTTMCKRFADIGWSGTEVTVMPGQVTASRRRFNDTFLELGEIAPALALGGLAIHLSAKAVRAQLRHLNKTTIIITARPMPGAEQDHTELWCFRWDTAIQRAHPGKDPFARVFEYLHTALHQQGILLAPPRLVDGEELPEDHPPLPRQHCPDAGQLPRSRHQVPPVEGAVMTPGFSLRRLVFRRRYLHALVAADPHEAATRCINYWASR